MPLVTCIDCGREVSDRAKACPACGGPMEPEPGSLDYRPTQTVEHTAKKWKAMRLWGTFAIFCASVSLALGLAAGSTVAITLGWSGFIGGIIVVGYARFGAWWYHG